MTGNIIANQMPNWSSGRGCNLYRFNFATGRETTVAAANSPGASEFLPTIWKTRVAFARVYERKQGIGGDRAYLYFRGVEGAGKSVQVPAGSRSTQRFCSGKPRRCKRLVEPGPTALDLAGRRLAFGWDSGASGPTTAAYYATLRAHSKKHRVEFGSSGSIQAEEVLSPVVDSGMVYWGLGPVRRHDGELPAALPDHHRRPPADPPALPLHTRCVRTAGAGNGRRRPGGLLPALRPRGAGGAVHRAVAVQRRPGLHATRNRAA